MLDRKRDCQHCGLFFFPADEKDFFCSEECLNEYEDHINFAKECFKQKIEAEKE